MIVDFTLANSTSQMESYNKQIDGFFWSWNVCHLLCYNKKGESSNLKRKNQKVVLGSLVHLYSY